MRVTNAFPNDLNAFPVDNQSGINKHPMKEWQLNPRGSTLKQNRKSNVGSDGFNDGSSAMVPKRAHFKDWHSNLINDDHVEKLL